MGDLAKPKDLGAGEAEGADRAGPGRKGPEAEARRPQSLVVALPGVDLQTVIETIALLRSLDGQPGLDPFNRRPERALS
ncbi:hypothetical protein [Afifella marina]|uniref:Uncharacterized protein n=1 Tax=Afifella marina DSM 2698 TaxID=1120955 RepID=A0A1G5M7L5_AFIMA|nr:hypothetical protein [Afifella marina]SCZ20528.1 hypothetical protein SAMN03080610_00152 [Afifella marina DSM 2698]